MASNGIRRKVDDLGRVVIPAGIRRSLNIREGDAVEVSVEGERVVLAKPRDACVFCGREDETLQGFRGRLVCRDCVGTLGAVDDRLRAAELADAIPERESPTWAPAAHPSPTTLAAASAAPSAQAGPRAPAVPEAPMAPRAPAVPEAPMAPTASPRSEPARPGTWPDRQGPIDGDDVGRRARDATHERSKTDRRSGTHQRDDPAGTDTRPRREPPPYDPASTTAW